MTYAETLYRLLDDWPIITNEWIGRDIAYTGFDALGSHAIVMHPLMLVQLRANGDFNEWLTHAEAWVVARADRQARAAMRRLDEMVEVG